MFVVSVQECEYKRCDYQVKPKAFGIQSLYTATDNHVQSNSKIVVANNTYNY